MKNGDISLYIVCGLQKKIAKRRLQYDQVVGVERVKPHGESMFNVQPPNISHTGSTNIVLPRQADKLVLVY